MAADTKAAERQSDSTVGPTRPTLVEALLARLPLPYGWTALLVAALLGPPGSILVAYLETGHIQLSIESFFYGYLPERAWQRVVAILLWYAFYTNLLLAIRRARRSVVRSQEALAPLLPDPGIYTRIFGAVSYTVPALLIGLVLEALFIGDYRTRLAMAPGPFSTVYEAVSGPPLYAMAGTAVWVHARAMWGLYQLGRVPLKLKPFYEDKTMGLRPMAALSLSLSAGYFVLLLIMVLMLVIGPVRPEYPLIVISLLLVGVVLFFLPLLSTHARMKREKRAVQAALATRWRAVLARSFGLAEDTPPPDDARNADPSAVVTLEALERKVNGIRTWPVDVPILGRLGVMALSIVLGLLTHFFKNLLGL